MATSPESEIKLLRQQTFFKITLLAAIIIPVSIAIFIGSTLNLTWSFNELKDYKNFLEVFAIPSSIFSVLMGILAFYSVLFKTDQTSKQMQVAQQQIKDSKKSEKISHLNSQAQEIIKVIFDRVYKEKSIVMVIDRLLNDMFENSPGNYTDVEVGIDEKNDAIQVKYKNNGEVIYLRLPIRLEPFELLKSYIKLAGAERARQALIIDDIGLINKDFNTFKALIANLLNILNIMLKNGHDIFLARHLVSMIYDQAKILYSMGQLDGLVFQYIGIILSLPYDDKIEIGDNLVERLTIDLNVSLELALNHNDVKFIDLIANNETGLHKFKIKDMNSDITYVREENKQWSECS